MNSLRKSVIHFLISCFKLCMNDDVNIDYIKKSNIFENYLYNNFSTIQYAIFVYKLFDILISTNLHTLELSLAYKYITDQIMITDIINYKYTIDNNPRNIIINHFNELLIKYNIQDSLKIAKLIERSCYNYIIKFSKTTENPPCRQWQSSVFKELYSNRCGTIYNLLNPESISCKTYCETDESLLINKIKHNTIDVKLIGYMNEKKICPASIQKEVHEINLRSEQHIVEKESNLFKCPNCKERRVTYKEVQLRALDEAPDYLCTCLNCKHKFKGRN